MYAMTGLYAESTGGNAGENSDLPLTHDTVIRCHSRNPSSGIMDHRWIGILFLAILHKKANFHYFPWKITFIYKWKKYAWNAIVINN